MISQNKTQFKELLLPDYELVKMNEQELIIHHTKSKKIIQKNWFDRLSRIVSIAMLTTIVVFFQYSPDNFEKYSLDFLFLFVCGAMLLFKKFFLVSVKGRSVISFCLSYLCIVSLIIHVGGEKPEGVYVFLFCLYFVFIFGMLWLFSTSFPVGITIKNNKVEILERKAVAGLYKKSYAITQLNCNVIKNYKYVTKKCYLIGKTVVFQNCWYLHHSYWPTEENRSYISRNTNKINA
ncbi:hypothetical protein [Candidatus Uabimicrobium sp. HlEnr_7]|uniref:hypothetical protein n=1 Tax=Candidatus Uabimicrobium helgolandensis TaxID=3095367 RepID=UPI003556E6F2